MRWLKKLSYTRIIALSFFIIILSGTLLLMLPISSRDGGVTSFLDSMFTATSATCVTGLIVFDTYTHWSLFGQLVILTMIQIGGLGLMTIITMFAVFMKKRIGLRERQLLMQSAGTMRLDGIIRLIKKIVFGTLIIEGIGALLLSIRFIPKLGILEGIYYSVFHAVSAFCNAGFDLMGQFAPYSSLTAYETDYLVSTVIMALIIIGGIGFMVWGDLLKCKLHISAYSLHTKIVLITSFLLLLIGTVGFFIFEYSGNLAGLSLPDKLLSASFMSTTTRTAGFNTMDLAGLSDSGNILSNILMLIGGSPGSTAGGIKTTTIAVIFMTIGSMAKGYEDVTVFRKRLNASLVKHAAVIIVIYVSAVLLAAMAICFMEPADSKTIFFETASAAGTVGLTQGLTPTLCAGSKIILMILMFGGRIGGLSLLLVFAERRKQAPLARPSEQILIG